jgi:hypothetical protein
MKNKLNLFIFLFLTLFLTGVIFLIDTFYCSKDIIINNKEEEYIDKSLFNNNKIKNENIKYIEIAKKIIKENNKRKSLNIKEKAKINFAFIPNSFKKNEEENKKDILEILFQKKIYSFLNKINILFYENRYDVR